jgi:uncharacterized protein (TIGR02147 family)
MTTPLSQFSDYRAFLLAHAQERRARNPRWSYGCWARQLGLQGASSLTKIVQGKRNPGPEIIGKLVAYFKLGETDAAYFRDLVAFQKHKRNPQLAVLLWESVRQRHPGRAVRILDDRTFQAIANWYFYAIREMVRLDTFFEDPRWIAHRLRFPVAPRDVAGALRTLLELGLLGRDERGSLVVAETPIDTANDFASEALRRHHEQMLEHAKTAVRTIEPQDRELTSTTFVMMAAQLPDAKRALRRCREALVDRFEKKGGDTVYQLQMQLFPLTRAPSPPRPHRAVKPETRRLPWKALKKS